MPNLCNSVSQWQVSRKGFRVVMVNLSKLSVTTKSMLRHMCLFGTTGLGFRARMQ